MSLYITTIEITFDNGTIELELTEINNNVGTMRIARNMM